MSEGRDFLTALNRNLTDADALAGDLPENLREAAGLTDGALVDVLTAKATASRAVVTDADGDLGASSVTATELGYLGGVTSAIQTQINAKAPTASPTFTGTVSGVTAAMVGLGNVDNTADADKPISALTQAALDLKAAKGANSDITSLSGLTTPLSVAQGGTGQDTLAELKTAMAFVKADVGLGNVDNTSDASKPISTATQAALDVRAFQVADIATGEAATIPAYAKVCYTQSYDASAAYGVGGAKYKRVTSETSHDMKFRSTDRYLPDGTTDADDGGWWEIAEDVLTPAMAGAVGDGTTDDTAALTQLLTAASGKFIILDAGATYEITSLTIPAGVLILAKSASFVRSAASTTACFTIEEGVSIDRLELETPGGSGGDKSVRIRGSNVEIGSIAINATAEGVYNSVNYAVEIESNPSGTQLSDIKIGGLTTVNFSTAVFAKNVKRLSISNIDCEKYRVGVYLRDVCDSVFDVAHMHGLGAAANGTNGENGLLMESTLSSGSTNNIVFRNWLVEDSGEHGFRIGGSLTVRDISYIDCISKRPGSAILGGNPSSVVWTGGCGFKVLGSGTDLAERHKNIFFTRCGVVDVNMTFGAFPGGHGVNNFTPFLIVLANNVHLTDCWIKAEDQTYSCRNGLLTTSVDGLFVTNPNFRDCESTAFKPYEEVSDPLYPAQDTPIENLTITGGLLEVTAPSSGIVFYVDVAAEWDHKNWKMSGTTIRGGATAVRINTVAGGSYTNISLDYTYLDTNVVDASDASPSVLGNNYACLNVVAPWRPSAFSPAALDGSVWRSTSDGIVRIRKNGAWYPDKSLSGTYTPTGTIVTNLDALTPFSCQYMRVGDVVTVSGAAQIDATATGAIEFGLSLPIASNFTGFQHMGGVVMSENGNVMGTIAADAANDRMQIRATTTTTAARNISFHATYVVI
jgi:hypothetical protein